MSAHVGLPGDCVRPPMPTIVVASTNPVKVRAAARGLRKMFTGQEFTIIPVAADSGVPDQPMSDAQTLSGALNRAQHARALVPEADYWVGIEGGIEAFGAELAAFAWVAVVCSLHGTTGKARSATFFLPPAVSAHLREGKELGAADDLVFGRSNSKQENGAVGLLTGNVLDREGLYEQAVILACVPFKNAALYRHQT